MDGESVRRAADPDSRTRTHLANERTFLAWLRTGLSLIALGLGSAQFLNVPALGGLHLVLPLSVCLVGGGVAVSILGGVRFADARRRIEDGAYRPRQAGVVVTVVLVTAVGLVALAMVIALRRL